MDDFFIPLKKDIDIAEKEIAKITIEDKYSDVECDKCGKFMVIKHGRFGDFLHVLDIQNVKIQKQLLKKLEVPCPKCGGKILEEEVKKVQSFLDAVIIQIVIL